MIGTAIVKGVIHGNTIKLDCAPDFLDGETVSVTLNRIQKAPEPEAQNEHAPVEVWIERLVFDSSILPGVRIVKGTTLAAEDLVAEIESGRSDEEMLRDHPQLCSEDLVALRHFAKLPLGFRLTIGAWAEDAEELDQFVEETRQYRRLATFSEIAE